jgi:hypothetical protein
LLTASSTPHLAASGDGDNVVDVDPQPVVSDASTRVSMSERAD